MVKFNKVDPNEIDNIRRGRRGRVSYPILKGFLETNLFLAELDTHGMQQSKQSLTSSLNAYIRNHTLPVKLFQRQGKIYLMRLDIDEEGNIIENWAEVLLNEHIASLGNPEPKLIDSKEVDKRFEEEKGQTTK